MAACRGYWGVFMEHIELSASQPQAEPVRSVAAEEIPPQRYDRMAKAAATGLMAHPDVDSAVVRISGKGASLVFHLSCTIDSERDPSRVMGLVSNSLVPHIELMLGSPFATRDLHFDVAPRP